MRSCIVKLIDTLPSVKSYLTWLYFAYLLGLGDGNEEAS